MAILPFEGRNVHAASKTLLGLVAFALARCGSPAAANAPAPPVQCSLGDPPAARAPIAVAGYPPKYSQITEAERADKIAALERKVPGWTVTLDETGYVRSLRDTLPAPNERTISSVRVATVERVLAAIASDIDLVASAIHASADGANIHIDGAEHRVSAQQVADSATISHLRIDVSGRPPLETSFHALDKFQILARWGDADRAMRITTTVLGHPCDQVMGSTCSTGGGEITTCVPLKEINFSYATVKLPDGVVRRVAFPDCPPRVEGGVMGCDFQASVPTCLDAITGEPLERSICAKAR